jgi:hypothetical protein
VDAVRQAFADAERFVPQNQSLSQTRSQSGSSKDRDFIKDKGAIVATNKHNIGLAIEKLGASIRWNELTHQPFLSASKNPKPRFMNDDDFIDLRLEIQEKFRFLPTDDSGVIALTIPEISRPPIPGLSRPPVPELCRPPVEAA